MSDYTIRIVHKPSGTVVTEWEPREGFTSFAEDVADRVRLKGVGYGRSTSHVWLDVKTAIQELLFDLHRKI